MNMTCVCCDEVTELDFSVTSTLILLLNMKFHDKPFK